MAPNYDISAVFRLDLCDVNSAIALDFNSDRNNDFID